MKTSELTGAALDWAVAKCIGGHIGVADECVCFDLNDGEGFNIFKPSTDWAQGGPIIDKLSKKGLRMTCFVATYLKDHAYVQANSDGKFLMGGTTPLVAAMRCYVSSKLGDTVDIPKELQP